MLGEEEAPLPRCLWVLVFRTFVDSDAIIQGVKKTRVCDVRSKRAVETKAARFASVH